MLRKESWTSSNFPSQFYQNRSKHVRAGSLPSCSPPLGFSVSPTQQYLVPKPDKPTVKRKANSLPRIGKSSVAPVYNPVKSEPDDGKFNKAGFSKMEEHFICQNYSNKWPGHA